MSLIVNDFDGVRTFRIMGFGLGAWPWGFRALIFGCWILDLVFLVVGSGALIVSLSIWHASIWFLFNRVSRFILRGGELPALRRWWAVWGCCFAGLRIPNVGRRDWGFDCCKFRLSSCFNLGVASSNF